ncbi:hypothetical protein FQZ97_626180 [compost metagenome]
MAADHVVQQLLFAAVDEHAGLDEHAPDRRILHLGTGRHQCSLVVLRHRFEAHLQEVALDRRQVVQQPGKAVTQRALPALWWGQDVAGQYRQVDHRLGVVAALLLVAVQQFLARQALDYQSQFPGEVAGIAHAAVVTLALPHRHDVGGVPGENDTFDAELASQASVVGIDALADQFDAVRVRQHLGQQLAHVLRPAQLLFGLTGHHHEFESAHAVWQCCRDIGTYRVAAQVDVGRGQWIVGDVDDDPLVGRGLALKGNAQGTTDKAVAAVASDRVAGPHVLAALRSVQLDADPIGILAAADQITREQHLHIGETRQALVKYRIDLGLDEGIATGPAELVGHWLDIGEAAALGGQEAHRVPRRGVRQDLVHQADRLDGAQGFVIDADGARVVDQLVELLDHQDLDAGLAQVVGNGQSHGARAHHHHVGVVLGSLSVVGSIGVHCFHGSHRVDQSGEARHAGKWASRSRPAAWWEVTGKKIQACWRYPASDQDG